MLSLPKIPLMLERTRALAAIELILSPDWDSRYYSFNCRWSAGEQMASMRNGSGDEWFMLFSEKGWAALKGLDHEAKACSLGEKLVTALKEAIPAELGSFIKEPAFGWESTTFAYYAPTPEQEWLRVNDLTPYLSVPTGEEGLLKHLIGSAEDYVEFAEWYFEISVDIDLVASIFALKPITPAVVRALNPEIELDAIASELFDEIGYPKP